MKKNNEFMYLADNVSNCHSYIFHIKLRDYLELVHQARKNSGNIDGQRLVLKSQSAKVIRDQMKVDFSKGGVLPPVVIGLVERDFTENSFDDINDLLSFLTSKKSNLCILDGMQRTQAMIDAGEECLDNVIRVELWLTNSLNRLIYRMLVLNTGQVPWTMQRQLEVVLFPVIKEIKEKIEHIDLPTTNDEKRRTQSGKFQASKIIESFLVFGSRSEKANTRDAIAGEYAKLDFIESSSKQELLDMYICFLQRLVKLDIQLDRVNDKEELGKFKKGIDVLGSHPALIGITTAFAIKILGRPKMDYSFEKQQRNMSTIMAGFDEFLSKLESMTNTELRDFLNLPELNSMSPSSASSKIGDQERTFFKQAFNVLIEENFDVPNMNVCWGH
ncbi:hypothetical protein XM75_c20273 [Vibrio vulnificus]|uniref:hypothetical protein n=1 Tax=Vibrio vulnificus TaxID=672 RepID=UPI0009B5F082|nr:hypothetical protein [Vibrio vulnificus]OQK46729.1 hypothetical protein XM75_c20273 [Vibrio vulnificus]